MQKMGSLKKSKHQQTRFLAIFSSFNWISQVKYFRVYLKVNSIYYALWSNITNAPHCDTQHYLCEIESP